MELSPRLVVSDPDAAMEFYAQTFGAVQHERYTDGDDRVVHVGFSIGSQPLSLTQCVPEWGLLDPLSLGGSPCLLYISTDEPDEIAARFVAFGGKVLIKIADRPYGKREGRVADVSGHLWILSKTIEELPAEEIHRRLK